MNNADYIVKSMNRSAKEIFYLRACLKDIRNELEEKGCAQEVRIFDKHYSEAKKYIEELYDD